MGHEPTRRASLAAGAAMSLLPWWAPATPARAQAAAGRAALVIGNAAYARSPLLNPVRDARAMAEALRGMGFAVQEVLDAAAAAMREALTRFRDSARAAGDGAGAGGVALLYYAGHGVQLDWRNYLLPVDAAPERADDVPRQALGVHEVLQTFAATGARTHIVVLDACRDNPFGGSGARGLAPLDAPPGTFFAYATAPGHVAEDGSGADGHGLYTRFLLQEIGRPGASIEDVFKRVRLHVRQASRGRQIPWESTSLTDDFQFASGRPAPRPDEAERDARFDAERADWERVRATARPEDLFDFLRRHPTGLFAEYAQFRLDQLARPPLTAQRPASIPTRLLPSGAERYRVGDEWTLERTDHLNGDARQTIRSRVTAIEGERVIVNRGALVLDQMGNVIENRFGVKDPGILAVPADLQVGKRWRSGFVKTTRDGRSVRSYYEHRVEAFEEIEVPAGRFGAFRSVWEGASRGEQGGGRRLQVTSWVDPQTMMTLRHAVRFSTARDGRSLEHTTDQMVQMRLVPR